MSFFSLSLSPSLAHFSLSSLSLSSLSLSLANLLTNRPLQLQAHQLVDLSRKLQG